MNAEPQRLGKYELLQRLGRGGMAEVWKAFDPQLRRFVAIKFLHANLRADPDFMLRFVREAQAIAALRHANIVQIHDFQLSSYDSRYPMPYMVMDYIDGQTLADYIRSTSRQGHPPSSIELLHLFTPVCLAVAYAHQHGMIHRDIKPGNILLDSHNRTRNAMGEPILTDFGIFKLMGTATGTFTSASPGTPLYISPEQVRSSPGDERSDIYSLGVILYELCTGVPPFRGETPYALWMQHVYDAPTRPGLINQHISPALEAVILKCLEKEPERRFPQATLLVAALAQALNLPVPDEVQRAASPMQLTDLPTYFQPLHSDTLPGSPSSELAEMGLGGGQGGPGGQTRAGEQKHAALSPGSPALPPQGNASPVAHSSSQPPASAENLPVSLGPFDQTPLAGNEPSPYATELNLSGVGSSSQPRVQPTKPVVPTQPVQRATSSASVPPAVFRASGKGSRYRSLLVALAIVVVTGLVAASLIRFLSPHPSDATAPRTAAVAPLPAGQVSFESSNQGTNDEVAIILRTPPHPAAGKSDYGWLLPDQSNLGAAPMPLGRLQINQAQPSLLAVDPRHSDLLAKAGSILITEESTNAQPQAPISDKAQWRYVVQLPQMPGTDGLSDLAHLRYLLTSDPDLQRLGINGGLTSSFRQSIEEIWKWSMEGVDHTDPADRRRKVVNSLYYLHGLCTPSDLSRAAPNTTTQADLATIAENKVSLLACAQTPTPGNQGYIDLMISQLDKLVQSPDATANQKKLASQLKTELLDVKGRLELALLDAQSLLALDDAQFAASPLMQQMEGSVGQAYGGWADPASVALHPGANMLSDQVQSLATFDLQPYTA